MQLMHYRFGRLRKLARIFLLTAITWLASQCIAQAQKFPFDQVHLAVPDIQQAMNWYRSVLGGLPAKGEPENRLFFGTVRICFLQQDSPQLSDSAVIRHVAFKVTDLGSTFKQVVDSGGKTDGQLDHETNGIMVRDPWGTKLELLPGDSLSVDHVEICSSDPQAEKKWFSRLFGGEQTTPDNPLSLRFDGFQLYFSEGEATGSEGTSFNHIGWRTDDIIRTVSRLRGEGVLFLSEIEPRGPVTKVVFVESPSGVKVEILQR